MVYIDILILMTYQNLTPIRLLVFEDIWQQFLRNDWHLLFYILFFRTLVIWDMPIPVLIPKPLSMSNLCRL